MEEWRNIVGNKYQVSSAGNIRRVLANNRYSPNRKPWIGLDGRKTVNICNSGSRTGVALARLVYTTFKGNIPSGYDVHHIDGNPGNNTVSNLVAIPPGVHLHNHFAKAGYVKPRLDKYDRFICRYFPQWKKIFCIELNYF